jgi:hydroxymethylglutaryl-CoA lyase
MHDLPRVEITEEGMREGMQIESADITAEDKVRLLDALSRTGLSEIVVGSFVSPKWTPQMANLEEVLSGFTPREGVRYTALAVNAKGRERAAAFTPPLSDSDRLGATLVHHCDVFVQRNYNRTQHDEIDALSATVERAVERGASHGSIISGAAWGSNWTGPVSTAERLELLDRQRAAWIAAGFSVTSVGFLDPMGWTTPQAVSETIRAVKERWPEVDEWYFHLHDTRGLAMASVYAALDALEGRDLLKLDSAIGGMGGCPYCGNGRAAALLCTEDLVHFLHTLGVETGVDLDALVEAVWLAEEIVGHPLYGHVSKAGGFPSGDRLYPLDMPFIETLDQARHFIEGPGVYEGALSPWSDPVRSWQRPDG